MLQPTDGGHVAPLLGITMCTNQGVRAFLPVDRAIEVKAVDSQQAGHVLVVWGLSSGQQVEHLEAGLLMAVMFMAQALLEHGDPS